MRVTLISHTFDPEHLIEYCARTCTNTESRMGIAPSPHQESKRMIEKLLAMEHDGPLEHAVATFRIDGVSRAMSLQLVRHRIASYCQKSQRYVSESQFEYVTPRSIKESPWANATFVDLMSNIQSAYNRLIELGIKKEDARAVLPNACATSLVATMNFRTLRHFFKLRLDKRAQEEIREMATEMFFKILKVAPSVFSDLLPLTRTN